VFTAEDYYWMVGEWPLEKGNEIQSAHFEDISKLAWLIEHPCAGNIDLLSNYGKWVGDATTHRYVEYDQSNWPSWNPGAVYHYGSPVVLYRWGPDEGQVDLFVLNAQIKGDLLNLNPPVMAGVLSNYWLLTVDPNKYSHWNFNAGRPGIGADARWIMAQHGQDELTKEWWYGRWEAWRELPKHTDKFEQIPYLKTGPTAEPRSSPVEQDRDHISQLLKTQTGRSFTDGSVGVDPITYWVHKDIPTMYSEYAAVSGEPVGSLQVGPDYTDRKLNQAHQDRVQHLIERNYTYLWPVDQFWKDNWQYWQVYGMEMDKDHDGGCLNAVYDYAGGYRGAWVVPTYYYKGENVYHNGYWWRCIMNNPAAADNEPGVGVDYSTYWADPPLHQPNYIATDPIYVRFNDPLWRCNSSAFEKVLEIISQGGESKCDWYFDDKYPAMDWITYQKHYHLLTLHDADPTAGWRELALRRYPLPRGCWRRIWRHTQHWDQDRVQKGRFGKEIDINGKMVSMMWPGELGTPPGFTGGPDDQLVWFGDVGGIHYDFWIFRYLVTQEVFDNMERPGGSEWIYDQYYIAQDTEQLFRDAYRANTDVEAKIAARHDPVSTEWLDSGGGTMKEYPVYEIHHDLLNDLRDALSQLRIFGQYCNVEAQVHKSTAQLSDFSTSLAAYAAGKAHCEAEIDVDHVCNFMSVGYIGMVVVDIGPPVTYDTSGTVSHDYWTSKHWHEITITKGSGEHFPAKEVGTLIMDVKIWWEQHDPGDTCTIGAGSFTYKPPADGITRRAFIGEVPIDCDWVYDGSGGDPGDWSLQCTFRISPADPWPPDAAFNLSGVSRDWYRGAWVEVTTGSSVALAWELDFEGFETSVFEQDPHNFIEV